MGIFIFAIIVYIATVLIGIRLAIYHASLSEEDKKKPIKLKHLVIVIAWFVLFASSQMTWIGMIVNKFLF